MIRIVFVTALALHGLLHLFGFARGLRLAVLPPLARPISRLQGIWWLVACLLSVTAAALVLAAPQWWWVAGAMAAVLSQGLLFTEWRATRLGTVANVALLVGVLYGFAARGPFSLPAEFARLSALATAAPTARLTEAELAPLPPPVQRYVRAAGVVGQPRVQNFRATWSGRIRGGPQAEWMAFTAQQLNTYDPPRRFFLMDAVMKGLPVDVLHVFDGAGATMRVRLLSVKTMVDARGEVLTRSETVTLFNDLCFFAPGELVRPSIVWEPVDEHSARARYTQGPHTITATLLFNDAAELVDFSSDDRSPSPEGLEPPQRWTTPAHDYGQVGPARVPRRAETRWHPASGAWTYGEFTLTGLEYNVGR